MIYLALLVVEIFLLWRLSKRLNSILIKMLPTGLYALIFVLGTFVHELSHYLTALALMVPVGKFTVTPKIYEKEVVLGSVAIAKVDLLRRVIIGAAPIFVGLTAILTIIYASLKLEIQSDWRIVVLIAYIVFVIGNTMFSSKKDLEGAWILGIILAAVAIGLYLLGVRISIESDFETLKIACQYMLVPLAIDLIILLPISLRRG